MRKINYIPDTGDLDADYCTGREMMDAARSLIRTASGNFKTNVTFGGETAYTDGSHVNLPSLPEDINVTKRQGLVTSGFGLHETLHQLMTDFRRLTPIEQRWHNEGKVFTSHLANAMEDIRIELGGQLLQPGIPKTIDKTAQEVNRKFIDEIYPEDPSICSDIAQIGPVAVTWEGRRRLGYESALNEQCLDLLSDDVRKWVNMVVDAVETMPHGVKGQGQFNQDEAFDGSLKLHKLAEQIANDYGKQRNEPEEGQGKCKPEGATEHPEQPTRDGQGSEPDGQDDGLADGKGDQGATGSSGDADSTSASGADDSGSGKGSQDQDTNTSDSEHVHSLEQRESSGQGNTSAHGAVIDSSGNDWERQLTTAPVDPNLDNVVKEMFDEMKNSPSSYRPLTRDLDCWVVPRGSSFKHPTMQVIHRIRLDEKGYANARKKIGNKVGTMRRKLERGIMAEDISRHEGRKLHGRLDSRRLTALANYNADVFRHRVRTEAVNTAITIVIDLSGSMEGYEAHLAQYCAIAIAEALQGTKCVIEIVGHNTKQQTTYDSSMSYRSGAYNGKYNRADPISMYMFKQFNETLAQAKGALGRMAQMTGGANADGDAWMYAYDRLIQRPEPRKIMLCMADGHPAYYSDFGDQYTHTADMVNLMSQNVDVVGIGINDASVKQFFPRYVVVTDLEDLPKQVMDQLGKLLLGDSFKVDNSELIKTDRSAINAKIRAA